MLISLLLMTFHAGSAGAQDRWRVRFDATVGLSAGIGSAEHDQTSAGLAGDLIVAARLADREEGRWIGATALRGDGVAPLDDSCRVDPGGGCVPRFPDFATVSFLGGWENGNATRRFLTGPSVVRDSLRQRAPWTGAWSARLDLTSAVGRRFGLVASLRSTLVPSYRGRRYLTGSVGFGFRVG